MTFCDADRALRRKEADENGSTREEEEWRAKGRGLSGGGNVRPRYMEAYIVKHRHHIKVGILDEEEGLDTHFVCVIFS